MARILDLTGPSGVYATRLLAEVGHDVIRIESPAGDAVRRLEDGAFHRFFNAGKRSVALDLASEADRGRLLRLVAEADAIVAAAPLPVPESELRARNPAIVLVLITGDDVPELCLYARSGLLSITGHPDRTPALMGGHIMYAATGLWVAIAAAAALLGQQRNGTGETVTVDVQQCFETFMDNAVENYMDRGRSVERSGARGSVTALAGALACCDGYWMLSLPDANEPWRRLVEWMQDPELAEDAGLRTYAARLARRDALLDRVGAWAGARTKAEIVAEAQRRHIPAAPVSTPLDLAADEQLVDRGFLVDGFPRGALATVWGTTMTPAPP